jgi:hypothetical protein
LPKHVGAARLSKAAASFWVSAAGNLRDGGVFRTEGAAKTGIEAAQVWKSPLCGSAPEGAPRR